MERVSRAKRKKADGFLPEMMSLCNLCLWISFSRSKPEISATKGCFTTFLTDMSSYAHLLPNGFKAQIAQWLQEDTPSFDYGGYVVGETDQKAVLYCKAEGILAGVPFFDEVFKQLDCR